MTDMTSYAEHRVLSLLLIAPERIVETGLVAENFVLACHREIFDAIAAKETGDILALGLSDDVSQYALGLDENWSPTNLRAFASIMLDAAEQRRFARAVRKLSGAAERAAR